MDIKYIIENLGRREYLKFKEYIYKYRERGAEGGREREKLFGVPFFWSSQNLNPDPSFYSHLTAVI